MDLSKLHERCFKNKKWIDESRECGCFYCLNMFPKEVIKEWVDKKLTALCPFCGIDSVIGDSCSVLSIDLLHTMHDLYFK